jgi:hypothetical protein
VHVELRNLYCSRNVIKSWRMSWAVHIARMGEMSSAYKILVEEREGKGSRGRTRCRRVDNIRLCLKDIGCGGVDSIHLAWAVINVVMNAWFR